MGYPPLVLCDDTLAALVHTIDTTTKSHTVVAQSDTSLDSRCFQGTSYDRFSGDGWFFR